MNHNTIDESSEDPDSANINYRQRYKELFQKMHLLMSTSQQVCWDWDLQKDFMALFGPKDCILGYNYTQISNGSEFWKERIHPEHTSRVLDSLQEVIDGASNIWNVEYPCRAEDGSYLWIRQHGVVTARDQNDQAVSMLGASQLIEQRKQTEIEKTQLLERYRSIVEAQGDAVFCINSHKQITFYNSVFAKKFLGETRLDQTFTLDKAIRRCPALETLATSHAAAPQRPLLTEHTQENGQLQRIMWQACPLECGDHNRLGETQFSGRDVSSLKTLEDALVTSNRENQAKDRFLAMISHDLRTPLNPILGLSEILKDRPGIDHKSSSIAESIHSAGQQLHQHIDSLLEMSKLDAETYVQEPTKTTLRQLRNEYESIFSIQAEKKGINFLTSLSGQRDETFTVDRQLLRTVLNNLIDNAIKFTPQGNVLLSFSLSDSNESDHSKHLQFQVADEGPGIPEECQKQVFQPFVRIKSSNTFPNEGVGLGLSICKRALEILKGELKVTRNVNAGMTFSGSIPVQPSPTSSKKQATPSRDDFPKLSQGTRALIVDDIESNRQVLKEVLAELNLAPESCDDGETAVDLINHKRYDIVFLDIHMQKMGGIEAHKKLIPSVSKKEPPYFVAVTADVTPQTRQLCSEVGIEDFITKPISRSKIRRVLSDFARQRLSPRN